MCYCNEKVISSLHLRITSAIANWTVWGVFQWSDESLFRLQLAMSGRCRCLFYKVGACGAYWLFVSSPWTGEFWRVLTLNSCDIRTSLFGFGDIKAQPAARACAFLSKRVLRMFGPNVHMSVCTYWTAPHTHTHIRTHTHCQRGCVCYLHYVIMGTYHSWKAAVIIRGTYASAQESIFVWVYNELK